MTSRVNLTLVGYNGKSSSVAVNFDDLDAGNFAAQSTLMNNLSNAVAGLSTGNLKKDSRLASETKFAVSNATNPYAKRGTKWMVKCRDTNGNAAGFEIPCADLSLQSPGTSKLDISTLAGAALVAAINAGAKSNDGETLVFVEAVAVTRTLKLPRE